MIVLLAFVILVVIILLDYRKNAEELSQLESGNTVEPSAISEEASITIHESCKTGNMQLLGFFMSLHVFIFVVDSDKRSMLHHFALNPNENSMAIVELLVERGLDVNAQDCDGNTPSPGHVTVPTGGGQVSGRLRRRPGNQKLEGNQPSQNGAAGYRQFPESHLKRARKKWWSRLVSNQRPPQCHCGALPTELRPHQGDGDCRDTLLTVNRFFA